jgi:hypothetical protein
VDFQVEELQFSHQQMGTQGEMEPLQKNKNIGN